MGKYTSLGDAYLSVIKSLQHASLKVGRKLVLEVRGTLRARLALFSFFIFFFLEPFRSPPAAAQPADAHVPSTSAQFVEASDLEKAMLDENPVKFHEAWRQICGAGGILVPGGFGSRGIEGKIAAVEWARTKKVPYLGICLGLQMAVIGKPATGHVVAAVNVAWRPMLSCPVVVGGAR